MIMDISQIRPLRWLGRLVVGIVGLYLLTQVIGRIMRRVRPGLTPLRAIPNLNMPLRWQFFGTPADLGSCWDQPWHAGPGDRARARLRDGALGRACLCTDRRQRDVCRDSAGDDREAR